MFEIGKTIIHKDHGLCKIVDIEHIPSLNKDYFIMYPKNNDATKIMVPVSMASSMLRDVVSKEECYRIISCFKTIQGEVIQDNKRRKEEYSKLLHSDNLEDLVFLILMFNKLFDEKKNQNKIIGSIDSSMYNEAKNKLLSEIAYVLNISSIEDVEIYIKSHLKENA